MIKAVISFHTVEAYAYQDVIIAKIVLKDMKTRQF